MKKIVLAVFAALMLLPGAKLSAQGKYGADSAECIKYLSYYSEYFKQKNYDEALPHWRKAYSLCPPTASQNMLLHGTTMYRRLIAQNAKNPIYKKALMDTLFQLHDTRAQYYPKYAVSARNTKGLDMANYMKDDPKALYEGYNEIIDKNKSATKANILLLNLNAAIDLYGNGAIGAEEVINVYQRNMGLLEAATPKTEADIEQTEKSKKDLESLFITSKVASCEELIKLFTPRYEENPNDLALVSNIVSMLGSTEDCTNNELFLKAVTSMHKLDPSYKSAYALYRLNADHGNVAEAVDYLEQAITSPESDSATDAEYYYELAVYSSKNGLKAKAVSAANSAKELDPAQAGKCYMLIGSVWGSLSCGGDEISRRAQYWVATDYMQKAKAADESLSEEANNLIAQYRRYYPQTAEAFMYDLVDGKSYTVSCGGMSATTTVRTQK